MRYIINLMFPGVDKDREIKLERLEVKYLQKGNGDFANVMYNLQVTDGATVGPIEVYDKNGDHVGTFDLVKRVSNAELDDDEFYGENEG